LRSKPSRRIHFPTAPATAVGQLVVRLLAPLLLAMPNRICTESPPPLVSRRIATSSSKRWSRCSTTATTTSRFSFTLDPTSRTWIGANAERPQRTACIGQPGSTHRQSITGWCTPGAKRSWISLLVTWVLIRCESARGLRAARHTSKTLSLCRILLPSAAEPETWAAREYGFITTDGSRLDHRDGPEFSLGHEEDSMIEPSLDRTNSFTRAHVGEIAAATQALREFSLRSQEPGVAVRNRSAELPTRSLVGGRPSLHRRVDGCDRALQPIDRSCADHGSVFGHQSRRWLRCLRSAGLPIASSPTPRRPLLSGQRKKKENSTARLADHRLFRLVQLSARPDHSCLQRSATYSPCTLFIGLLDSSTTTTQGICCRQTHSRLPLGRLDTSVSSANLCQAAHSNTTRPWSPPRAV